MVLEQVAFDIETTGFAADDVVTVGGFAVPVGVRVFVQTSGRQAGDVADAVEGVVSAEMLVNVSTHGSERELLEAVSGFVEERLCGADVLLVAFNGDRWKAGFDLPFLRTRYARRGMNWPFRDVPYADLLPVVTRRFNTTLGDGATDKSMKDLAGVYEVLCDGRYGEVDPFDDSAAAVTAFEDGRIADLVVYNTADVLRTRELGRLAERYCAKSEFNVKSLTPTEYG
jgi:uncharacterized protein YprB with RNaseH-like and TPR domain